ncbi:MAG: hypothetical protein JNL79_38550 [Myxococcales bacterium]|nr:hypothetical protein [Myxococcales bacterium]
MTRAGTGGRRLGAALSALALAMITREAGAQTWTATGSMAEIRIGHTGTALVDGRVLVCGGEVGVPTAASTTELYDPVKGTFSAGPAMTVGRSLHTATRLADGRVLVVGGRSTDDTATSTLSSAEIFDPKTGAFTATGSMASRRLDHAAVLLPSGRVLVTGGDDGTAFQSSAELFDPGTGVWSAAGTMAIERVAHTATLVGATVVVVGGSNGEPLASVDLFDPSAGTWSVGASMPVAHADHVALALDPTHLLVATGNATVTTAGAELLELGKPWSPLAAAPNARSFGRALLLPNGTALVVCGRNAGGPIAAADAFDPRTKTWSSAGSLVIQRERCAAAALPGGRVLVTGGVSGLGYESSAEVYAPLAAGASCSASGACASGACMDGVCCNRPCSGACERCDDGANKGTCVAVSGAKNHCPAAGQVCIDGLCRTGTGARCSDDGLAFEDTSGKRTSCNAYRCRPSDGACYDKCADSSQCAPGFACDGAQCTSGGSVDEGGCAMGHGPGSAVLALAAFALVVGAVRRRR